MAALHKQGHKKCDHAWLPVSLPSFCVICLLTSLLKHSILINLAFFFFYWELQNPYPKTLSESKEIINYDHNESRQGCIPDLLLP